MSTTAVKRASGNSPESGVSSKPKWKQASRSVSLLTPEQLQRKRAQDRESQRQIRARVKQTISELEKRMELLTQELRLTKLENASLLEKNQLAPPGTLSAVPPPPPQPVSDLEEFSQNNTAIMEAIFQQKNCSRQCIGVDSQFSNSLVPAGPQPPSQALLDPSLFFIYEGFEQPPMSIPVWNARPVHYPPTCRLDKAYLDLLECLKPITSMGGNVIEFTNPEYPPVSALLNPHHHTAIFPLTSGIVMNVIRGLTVNDFPEQVAILYVMGSMLRWIITSSEEDYYAMPDWLRPTAAQLVTAHPAWVDMMPWPKSRDRLCRGLEYHDKWDNWETFKEVSNRTISLNWPYDPNDTLIRNSPDELMINPVFISHVRNLDNWTYTAEFLEYYPEFEGEVNIGLPRKALL